MTQPIPQHDQRADHATTSPHPWVPNAATIQNIQHELSDTSTYELKFTDPDVAETFRFSPGQFNMLYLPGFGESAISISSDAERTETLSHTVRVAGNVTQALSRSQLGDEILLRGRLVPPGLYRNVSDAIS